MLNPLKCFCHELKQWCKNLGKLYSHEYRSEYGIWCPDPDIKVRYNIKVVNNGSNWDIVSLLPFIFSGFKFHRTRYSKNGMLTWVLFKNAALLHGWVGFGAASKLLHSATNLTGTIPHTWQQNGPKGHQPISSSIALGIITIEPTCGISILQYIHM
jgi:hypothetical protein